MSQLEKEMDQLPNDYDPPAWLREALTATSTSPEFQARCRHAVSIALSVAKMHQERSRTRLFVDLSLASCLRTIAQEAGVDLKPILEWLQVSSLDVIDTQNIRGVVRLAKEIGLSLRETIAHMRIGFAEPHGFHNPAAQMSFRRGASASGLEQCESALSEIESGYPLTELQQLRELEGLIHRAYRELE
jgi:hypothetical protein